MELPPRGLSSSFPGQWNGSGVPTGTDSQHLRHLSVSKRMERAKQLEMFLVMEREPVPAGEESGLSREELEHLHSRGTCLSCSHVGKSVHYAERWLLFVCFFNRVKLEEIVADDYEEIDDGFIYTTKEDKKRHRHKEDEEELSRNEGKHKRKKKKEKHNLEYSSCREETSLDTWDSQKRYTKRKRKEEVRGRNILTEGKEESSTSHSKKMKKTEREKQLATKKKDENQTKVAAAKMSLERANESFSLNSGKNSTKNITTQSRKKRVGTSDSSSTSSDSDSSELNVKENKSSHKPVVVTLPKNKSQAASDSDVKTNKVTVKSNTEKTKTAISKNAKKTQSSSSDSDSSTEDETVTPAQDSTTKEKSVPNRVVAVKASTKAPKAQSFSSDSDSSDSDTLVIRKSAACAGLHNSVVRKCIKQMPARAQGLFSCLSRGRGRGTGEDNFRRGPRGRGFRGMMRGHGRGANPGFFYNYSSEGQKQRQLNEAATNTSVLVQVSD